MKKNSPPLIMLPVLKGTAGALSVMLLVACSSPTKYPLRTPLKDSVSTNSSVSEQPVTYAVKPLRIHSPVGVCGDVYRVKRGDSLSVIAFKCQVPMKQLAKRNKIPPPYTIYQGQRLNLPQGEALSDRTAKPVSSQISAEPDVKAEQKIVSHTVVKPSKKEGAHQAWAWPVHKSLPYRFIRDEAGLAIIEIYGVAGQEIYAVASGKVVYSGNGLVNFGHMLVIKHDDNYMSVYAHNSALLVKEGDRVEVGQYIADLGATGNAQKPTLYLEARFQGRKVDIKKVLDAPKR